MAARPLFAVALTACLALADAARAVVINDAAGDRAATALGAPFGAVVQVEVRRSGAISTCSGALIASDRVLTADHCVRGANAEEITVRVARRDGSTRDIVTVETAATLDPPSTGGEGAPDFLLNGADVAVLALSERVQGRTPFLLFAGDPLGAIGRMVGYGRAGVASVGDLPSDGRRRAATNVIDAVGAAPDGVGFFAGSAHILSADFDDGGPEANLFGRYGSDADPMINEGLTAPGDSGGPLLVKRDGHWLIAGVLSGGLDVGPPAYGGASYWTSVASPAARAFLLAAGGKFARLATGDRPYAPSSGPGAGRDQTAVASLAAMSGLAAVPLPASAGLLAAAVAALMARAARARVGGRRRTDGRARISAYRIDAAPTAERGPAAAARSRPCRERGRTAIEGRWRPQKSIATPPFSQSP